MFIFKRTAGLAASVGAAMAACTMEDHPDTSKNTVKLGAGSKIAAVAAPMFFATVVNKAYEATPPSKEAIAVLEFALTLEYLESEFYKMGNMSDIIPDMYKKVYETIGKHEMEHVAYFPTALGIPVGTPAPAFDFTYDGNFMDTFTNFHTFSTISAALEDTGVRAYKGQAGKLDERSRYPSGRFANTFSRGTSRG